MNLNDVLQDAAQCPLVSPPEGVPERALAKLRRGKAVTLRLRVGLGAALVASVALLRFGGETGPVPAPSTPKARPVVVVRPPEVQKPQTQGGPQRLTVATVTKAGHSERRSPRVRRRLGRGHRHSVDQQPAEVPVERTAVLPALVVARHTPESPATLMPVAVSLNDPDVIVVKHLDPITDSPFATDKEN